MLNANLPLGRSLDGFLVWRRRMPGGSDEDLDSDQLMRLAGHFSRRVRASAKAKAARLTSPDAVVPGWGRRLRTWTTVDGHYETLRRDMGAFFGEVGVSRRSAVAEQTTPCRREAPSA